MTVQTSTGSKISIVLGTPATEDQAGYEALTYQEIGEVVDIPEHGPQYDVVTHQPLATGITEKRKGSVDYGSFTLGLGRDSSDAGQQVLSDAADGANKYDDHSFKEEFQNGDVIYYYGQVFGYTVNPSTANSIVGSNAQVEINSKLVEVTA